MPSTRQPATSTVANNTVKVPAALQERVLRAMEAEGFTVWSEFCRVALTEKCSAIEDRQRARVAGEPARREGEAGARPRR